MSVLKLLEKHHVEMHSLVEATRSISLMEWSPDKCYAILAQMLEVKESDLDFIDYTEIERTLKYVVAQYFDPTADLDVVRAHERAKALLVRFPYHAAETSAEDEDGEANPNVNDEGVAVGSTGKPKKGYKKDMALELYRKHKDEIEDRKGWVDLFVAEISGMSKAVANTYIHNIENGKWVVV